MTIDFKDEGFLSDKHLSDGSDYAGTDTRVDRTGPDRFSDIVNVKDWGAVGDGIHDDTNNIRAALDFAATRGRPFPNNVAGAILFFPPGIYYIGSPPLYVDRGFLPGQAKITWMGSGRDVTILRGNYDTGLQQHALGTAPQAVGNGFLIQVELGELGVVPQYTLTIGFSDLTVENQSTGITSGALINHGSANNRLFSNCHFIGMTGFCCTERTFGVGIRDCKFTCSKQPTAASEPAATRSPYFTLSKFPFLPPNAIEVYASVGAYMGEGVFQNLHAYGFDIGFSIVGHGTSLKGCSAKRCGVGVIIGIKSGSVSDIVPGVGDSVEGGIAPPRWLELAAGDVTSCLIDRCTQGMYVWNTTSSILANSITGTTGPTEPAPISGMSGSGTITVNTFFPHNITGTPTVQISPSTWTNDPDGFVTVLSVTGTNQFTFAGSSSPPSFTTGTWNWPLEYGINCILSSGTLFAANSIEASVSQASFVAQGAGNEGGSSAGDTEVWSTRGKYGWFPAEQNYGLFAAAAWNYEMCGGGLNRTRPGVERFPGKPNAKYLPGQQANIKAGPSTGKERNIVFADTTPFGGVVAAFFALTADAPSSTSVLQFAPLPSYIDTTFTVDNFNPVGTNNNSVISINGPRTQVTISPPLFATIKAPERIYFKRLSTDRSPSSYKVRFDGEAWIRIA